MRIGVAFLTLLLGSCAALISRNIAAPVRSAAPRQVLDELLAKAGSRLERVTTRNGPRLAYAVIEPGDHGFWYEFRAGAGYWTYRADHAPPALPPQPPRGTVLLVHGWSVSLYANAHWALALAERGYRSVLVDLRNHGRSDAAPAGFGGREAADLAALVATLRAQGRLQPPLTVLGVSLGAVAALHLAADEPAVRAVVALEPYANAADAVRSAFAGLAPESFAPWIGPATIERAIARLSRRLGLELTALDTAPVLARVPVCVLLLHGQRDRAVPVEASRGLVGANRDAQLFELPWDGHFSTPARLDVLADPLAHWIDAAAHRDRSAPCPAFVAYALKPSDYVRYPLARPWPARP